MLNIDVITLFPNFFRTPLQSSIVGKALSAGKVKLTVHDLRPYGIGKHQTTDDRPYGGGPGMVMLIEPIDLLLHQLGYQKGTSGEKIVLTSAKGRLYTQQTARSWSTLQRLCIICGHYEGVDERVAMHLIDEETRIGDYVLTGGEPASLVVIDSIARLQPGVLGNMESLTDESHDEPGKMSYPQYSRPEVYRGWSIPEVLKTGNHGAIAKFRSDMSRNTTVEANGSHPEDQA
jgi:tRNA (guanine37-N1)-methyltransferase